MANVNALIIAGGGGGGGAIFSSQAGGGAAGGYIPVTNHPILVQSYSITVGTGGGGGTGGGAGSNGADSIFDTFDAVGGGGGAQAGGSNGLSGGSGGGGGAISLKGGGGGGSSAVGANGANGTGAGIGGAATAGQGNAGGNGGSAAGAGTGNGGAGTSSSITGSATTYAAGGGGGSSTTATSGGTGGGGAGGGNAAGANAGFFGSGGGGGGTNSSTAHSGGNGAGGAVYISYPTGSITATGGTITTSGGQTIHTFTSNDTWIVTAVVTFINYDNSAVVNSGSSFTCTGPHAVLFMLVQDLNVGVVSINYGGVPMGFLGSAASSFLYYLADAPTGSNLIGINGSLGSNKAIAISFANASGTLDSLVASGVSSANPLSLTTTVVAANCWLLGFAGSSATQGNPITVSNITSRLQFHLNSPNGGLGSIAADSNGTVATGSQSVNFTVTGGAFTGAAWLISLQPYFVPPPVNALFFAGD